MLRFRNRFKGQPSDPHECPCGRRISRSITGGRETLIHELPWCARFEALVDESRRHPDIELHTALVSDRETIVVADGDTPADICNPVQPS
jgi:hypothetical protein